MIRLFYSIVSLLITPMLRIWLNKRAACGKENPARLRERFGYAALARPAGTLMWVHAASVGETQSILTLLRTLLAQHAQLHVLITTGTVTSAQLVAAQSMPRLIHQFITIDTYPAVHRFLQHWHPDLVLWVESELWPQLLWQLRDRRIPALLLNARISAKTAANWQKLPHTIRSILAVFTAIYAGSAEDANRLRTLGATDVREAGNLKYDAALLPYDDTAFAQMRQQIGTRPIWLAASTHAGEEQRIAAIHLTLVSEFPTLLTIIVPRHATRGDEIATPLRAARITVVQRSKKESITDKTDIYLADTMGELGLFYRLATIVLIGGSLVPHGGHNPLEAATLDCAIVTGPHMHNFAEIMAAMQEKNAIIPLPTDAAIQQTIAALLRSNSTRDTQIKNARDFMETARGTSVVLVQHINQLLAEL